MDKLYHMFLGALICILFVSAPTAVADEIAGRVMTIDRPEKFFTVQPYQNQKVQQLTNVTVTNKTLYQYNPVVVGVPTPTIDKVKRGSWVHVYHEKGIATKVIIHLEQPDVPNKSPQNKNR